MVPISDLLINFITIHRRFDPQTLRVYDSIRAGKIGTLRCIKATARDPPFPWQYDRAALKAYLTRCGKSPSKYNSV